MLGGRGGPVAAVGAGLLLVVASAAPASAHVHVSSADAAPGGYGVLVFRVPTESDTASTVKLSVTLPADTPFASVAVQPLAGWTVSAPERPLGRTVSVAGFNLTKAVTTVTWTADKDAEVKPGEFQQFTLSVGPFPRSVHSMAFPTVQTYSDGTVVRWVQPTTAGAAEPENPAPVLTLTGAPVDDDGNPLTPAASASSEAAAPASSDGGARALAAAALAVALLAAVLAALGLRRRQR